MYNKILAYDTATKLSSRNFSSNSCMICCFILCCFVLFHSSLFYFVSFCSAFKSHQLLWYDRLLHTQMIFERCFVFAEVQFLLLDIDSWDSASIQIPQAYKNNIMSKFRRKGTQMSKFAQRDSKFLSILTIQRASHLRLWRVLHVPVQNLPQLVLSWQA